MSLVNMVLFPRLGVTEWEKEGVNKVALDLDLYLDMEAAAREDRMSATVDYSEVYTRVQEVSKVRKYHLIESLTHDIVQTVFESFPQVVRVVARLRKKNLPFDANLDHVEVSLDRSR